MVVPPVVGARQAPLACMVVPAGQTVTTGAVQVPLTIVVPAGQTTGGVQTPFTIVVPAGLPGQKTGGVQSAAVAWPFMTPLQSGLPGVQSAAVAWAFLTPLQSGTEGGTTHLLRSPPFLPG